MTEMRVSPNCMLRAFGIDDAPSLFHLIESNRAYLRQWLPWLDQHRLLIDTNGFIGQSRREEHTLSGVVRGIWHNDSLCGVIDFHTLIRSHRKAEIGYWLGAEFQGHGIMTQAVRTMIDYGFETLNLNRIEIRCADQNHKSRHIPERLNFTNEGLIRDAEWLYDHFVNNVVYGMLARDWPTARG